MAGKGPGSDGTFLPMGPKKATTAKTIENRKIQKPYIKKSRVCLWDSGRWEGWDIILELIPPYYRDI